MVNSKGPSSEKSMMYAGKNPLLPPKIPSPSISPTYSDYVSPAIGPKTLPIPRERNSNHQRTSSESYLMEEQPSWLDELLYEPETPVRRGCHRRSTSDSFAYFDAANVGSMNHVAQIDHKLKDVGQVPSWGRQNIDINWDVKHGSFVVDPSTICKSNHKWWDTNASLVLPSCSLISPRDQAVNPNAGSLRNFKEVAWNPSLSAETKDHVESCSEIPTGSSEKKDPTQTTSVSEIDTKRAKQQFAQRSRVRKLQYIAELERNIQAYQAEGSEVSAQVEFLNQQNLILSMENKALKQRLESLAQEQLIKYMEHKVLEREVGRLQTLFQQQQQPQSQQKVSSRHRRANSSDLDRKFSELSLKYEEASAGRDSLSSQLPI